MAKAFGVELNARTNVSTQEGHYATNVKNVYVAGDNHRGQSLVVWAIREGVRLPERLMRVSWDFISLSTVTNYYSNSP